MDNSRSGTARRWRDRRVLLGLLAAPLALAGSTGCFGPSTPPVKPVQVITGPAGATADPALVKEASDAALAAYKGYFQAYVAAGADQDWESKDIDKYTADPARTQAHLTLRAEAHDKIVLTGHPVSTPFVTLVNINGPNNDAVSIADCIDATNWLKYDQKKKVYLAVSPKRYSVSALVVDYPGIGWLVQQVNETTDKC